MKLIDKDDAVAEIKKRRKDWQYSNSVEDKYKKEECDDILSLLDTFEVEGIDLMTHTLMIYTIIAECCDWLAMNTNLSHDEIEGCRTLMLTIKEEQSKAQKGE